MFLFSAKNSAGLFCCKTSAFLDIAVLLTKHGSLASCHIQYWTVSQKVPTLLNYDPTCLILNTVYLNRIDGMKIVP